MKTSEAYNNLELHVLDNHALGDYLAEEIARVMHLDKTDVQRAAYQTCLGIGTQPGHLLIGIYEFLMFLKSNEIDRKNAEKEAPTT